MSGRSWELEVCSVCGTVCGPPNDVPAAHTSEVSSCAEEGSQIERVRVYEHPTDGEGDSRRVRLWLEKITAEEETPDAWAVEWRRDAARQALAELDSARARSDVDAVLDAAEPDVGDIPDFVRDRIRERLQGEGENG
jgi:hypothetical protein